MADWLAIISALVLVMGFMTLTFFIQRLGLLEANAMIRPVMQPVREIPSQRVVGVRNPFELRLAEASVQNKGIVHLLMSCSQPCYVTLYWGVRKKAFGDEISRREKNNGDTRQDDDNDELLNDDDEVDNGASSDITAISAEKILNKCYQHKGPTQFYNPGNEHAISEVVPDELLGLQEQKPDDAWYPLIVAIEQSRNNPAQEGAVRSHDIVSFLTVYRSTKSSNHYGLHLDVQYIQTADGRLFPLKKLYVNDSEDAEPRPPSSEDSYGTCIVCQSFPVSRALLPCRHACVCGICFEQLHSKCPLCRQVIHSYFLTGREPNFGGTELDTSRQLNRMSFLDLVRGVLSAS